MKQLIWSLIIIGTLGLVACTKSEIDSIRHNPARKLGIQPPLKPSQRNPMGPVSANAEASGQAKVDNAEPKPEAVVAATTAAEGHLDTGSQDRNLDPSACPENINATFEKQVADQVVQINIEFKEENDDGFVLKSPVTGTRLINGKLTVPESDSQVEPFVARYRAYCENKSIIIEDFAEGRDTKALTLTLSFGQDSDEVSIKWDSVNPNNKMINRTDTWTRVVAQ